MKKITVIILAIMMLTIAVNAADPFTKIVTSPDTKLIDATEDQGANNHPIEYVENYGIGYTWIGDFAYFEDLDFGPNGADKMTIGYTYGTDDPKECILEVYLDSTTGTKIGTYYISNVGGYSEEFKQDFTIDVDIPGGIHTVYIKWTNTTGSLFHVQFNEAPEKEVIVEAASTEPVSAPVTVTSAPQTGDNAIIFMITALILSISIILSIKIKIKEK